ncbi:MAG: IS481 family transposase [Rhodospirillaceae bacterium]|nr:MAG: IS481 family transposase [Rhodospirillaceae bacterium]
MPWKEMCTMQQRLEFVRLAEQEGSNRRELCRRFGISPQTGYKWLERAASGVEDWVADRSRRPHASPGRVSGSVEDAVLAVRDAHPAWGARKIWHVLARAGQDMPAPSTVHAILARHGRISLPARPPATGRFELPAPNLIWQMDFKGRIVLQDGRQWCHPLTVVDDHSRYALCLQACDNETGATVQGELQRVFRRYGLPEAFLVDNGSPWGNGPAGGWTWLGVWLLKLGVDVIRARPYHPQTRGKNERFHRSLKAEVLSLQRFRSLGDMQRAFDRWRHIYNCQRPHQALGFDVPASRYRLSPRPMPDRLPKIDYAQSDIVRTVGPSKPYISFKGHLWQISKAFMGERVALRPLSKDGRYGVFFATKKIATIDLNNPPKQPQ